MDPSFFCDAMLGGLARWLRALGYDDPITLLGDENPPARYSDGVSMFAAPPDRFVVSTVGWEPYYAATGKDLKVKMYAGLGTAEITDPDAWVARVL